MLFEGSGRDANNKSDIDAHDGSDILQGAILMRPGMMTTGIVLLGVVWLGPLPEMAGEAFYAHMTMHMAVVAVAAPLIAVGLAGGRFDPVSRWPMPFHPILASVIELVIVWGWHAPALHRMAREHPAGLAAEQGMFFAAGLVLWLAAFGGRPSGKRAASGVVGLLLTAMHMTLLGALLALATRPLYHAEIAHVSMLFPDGLTALEDQHAGGAIMLLVGGISYLLGGLYLTGRILRHRTSAASGGEAS